MGCQDGHIRRDSKREREEARLEGERKGKLEERKRFIEFIMKSHKKNIR